MIAVLLLSIIGLSSAVWLYRQPEQRTRERLILYGNIDIRQVNLSFHDPEHIQQIQVQEGVHVKQGQLLAIQDLARFQYAIDRAEALTEVQRQVLNRLLNGSRPEEIAKARADVKAAQAEVVFAQKEYERMKKLTQKQLAPVESVDRARSEWASAMEKMKALTELQSLAVIGPRQEDIEEARERLKVEQTALKLARKVWQDAHLYAPNDGVIEDRLLEPGDMASSDTPVFTLALTDPVWARVYVSEKDLGKLSQGMTARISTDSFPDATYRGWIGYISPTAEFTPKTVETPELRTSLVYQVRIFACNPKNQLRLGMPVTVGIDLNQSGVSEVQACQTP